MYLTIVSKNIQKAELEDKKKITINIHKNNNK